MDAIPVMLAVINCQQNKTTIQVNTFLMFILEIVSISSDDDELMTPLWESPVKVL